MSNRTTVIAACAVVLSIAGCAGKTSTAQPNPPLAEVPATTSSSAPPLDPDALTPTGTKLAFGEAARVMYKTKSEGKDKTKIAVTPVSVKHAPISDFQDVNLKGDELTKEYFYVTMSFTNLGPLPMDPVMTMIPIEPRDTAGKKMTWLHFMIGSFAPCHQEHPDNLAVGATHTACRVYIAPDGQDAGEVVFSSYSSEDDPKTTEITWPSR